MRSHRIQVAAAVVAGVLFVGLWSLFAPTELGGSTTYAITDGISMKPLLHAGDLALIRPQSSYHVGEVVLYQNQILHRPVLHRIFLIQNGNYFFKGDHNGFVDPGYATRSELDGKLWFFVPDVGAPFAWFAKPLHAGLLAGGVALVFAAVGFKSPVADRRKRGRGRRPAPSRGTYAAMTEPGPTSDGHAPVPGRTSDGHAPVPGPTSDGHAPVPGERRGASGAGSRAANGEGSTPRTYERRSGIQMTPDQLARRRPPGFLEGPLWSLVSIAVCGLLAVVLLGVGFSRPLQQVVPLTNAYRQAGAFSYSAPVKATTAVYPTGVVSTGQPIYPSLVDAVTLGFGYRFTSALPHQVRGTIELRALVLSQANTWQESSTVKAASPFSGDHTSVSATLPLSSLYDLTNSVTSQSGAAGATYSVDIQPVVHFSGTVGGKAVSGTYAPVLPFSISTSVVTLDVTVAPAPPGATYVAPTASSALSATINPVQTGSIPQVVGNVVSVARYQIQVATVRVLGTLLALLAVILAVAHDLARRRRTLRTDEELTASRLHALVVPVVSLARSDGSPQIEIPDFAHLAELAQFLQRPILYELQQGRATYAVDDETVRYLYRPDRGTAGEGPVLAAAPGRRQPPPPPGKRSRWSLLARGGTALVVIAVLVTLTSVFTVSNSVPASNAGTLSKVLQVGQVAPAGCSGLTLTSIVTGSGVFANSRSNALVLGSAGADTITDTGAGNCIVGGGGTNTITGTSSDICVSGPTLAVSGPCPMSTPTTTTTTTTTVPPTTTTTTRPAPPSNGVTVTPASDNYNNYGGQERLSVVNTYAVTALSITITVAQTAGVTFNSQANSYPGGIVTQTSSVAGGTITYSFVLAAGQSIPAGYQSGVVYAQFGGSGSPHPMSGDTWVVASTANGIASSLSGTF